MPPKKRQAGNAFYWFMQDIMGDLRREGRVFPNGIQDIVPIATPRWKVMTEAEKERYENKAKLEKKRARQGGGGRLDNIGNIIGERGDEQVDLERRRVKERKWVTCRWPEGDDIMDFKFYLISFEYLCETEQGDFLPCEVGLIEWSMNKGITKMLHRFINAGAIPTGYRYTCQKHSDDTHHIPVVGFELADSNYRGLWIQIENFVNPNGENDEYPPIYFLGNERKPVEYCMDWLHAHACLNIPNRLHRLFVLETMIVELYTHKLAGTTTPSSTSSAIVEMLTTSAFDYEAQTRCPWHEEEQVRYCALGTVKRYAFALSDALTSIYDFDLTSAHLPTRRDDHTAAFTIIAPSSIHLDNTAPSEGRSRGNRGRQVASDVWQRNGAFASRDVRYREASQGEGVGRGTTTFDRLSNAWSGEPPVGQSSPWARPNAGPDGGSSEFSDWPTLGGDSAGVKFAGRTQAPAPSELPRPGWQPDRTTGTREQIDSRPTLGQTMSQKQDSIPTLGQVVQQKQDSRPTLGQAVQQKQDSRPTLGQAVQQKQDSRPTLGQAVQKKQDSRPTLGQAVQQKQDSRPTLGQAVQQRQDSTPVLGQSVQQATQIQPAATQQQMACGRGMGILTPGMWGGQPQRPGTMAQSRPAGNPWGAATASPLAGLGRGRGLFTPNAGQPARPTAPENQQGITRPPPGFGLGIADQFTGLGIQHGNE